MHSSIRLFTTRAIAASFCALGALFALGNKPAQAQVEWTIASGGNGHFYQLVATSETWEDARGDATALTFNGFSGHLATLTSQAENDFIRDTFGVTAWIGLSQPAGSPEPAGGWEWVTAEAFGFTNWQPGEPNNLGNERYGEVIIGERWNDAAASTTNFYYVEFGSPVVVVPEGNTLALVLPSLGIIGAVVLRRKK